ncbi:MAG: aminotransferase class V-fold PLP-dependent enzyme [Planctomycetia bacterium]
MTITRRTMLGSTAFFLAGMHSGRSDDASASPETMADDYREFVRRHPTWERTASIDALRRTEYPRLAASGEAYLDYTGASLHADSQVARHAELLRSNLLGNPHSVNRSSRNATRFVDSARTAVLEYFRAPPGEYDVIFTPNATGALRLVGECYPFGPERRFLLTQDNHNSVNGIGEFAKRAGATVTRLPVVAPDLRVDRAAAAQSLAGTGSASPGLFAFPAQSNFSGVRHPLELVSQARAAGWDVLLDAAAFAPTNPLDIAAVRPDFVCVSFYKMFGYPTGVGCLIARRAAMAGWRRQWFSGGNVKLASVAADAFVPATDAAAFEDGTIDFLSLPAVEIGLEHLSTIGVNTVHERVSCLASWTLERLRSLRHRSGLPLVRILGPEDCTDRGGTIAFTLNDERGRSHDIRQVCRLAASDGIGLRSGFFCNPGAGETAFGLTGAVLKPIFERRRDFTFDELRADVRRETGADVGALRSSFGIVSDFSDAWRFDRFVRRFVDTTSEAMGTEPRRDG